MASGDGQATTVEPEVKVVERVVHKSVRHRLPDERPSLTHKFSIAGHEGYLHIGMYPDTKMPGEIFITMAKEGSTISGLMDAFATSISIALQYNVPLEDLCNKFSHMRFEPNGFTNNRQIPIAKSIMDYIFRYLSMRVLSQPDVEPKAEEPAAEEPASDLEQIDMFTAEPTDSTVDPLVGDTVEDFLGRSGAVETATATATAVATATETEATFTNQEDAPPCSNCGSITVRSGACYSCPNCGNTSGCG